jgi:hypothetical protein
MGLQERDHREDPAVVVAGVRQLELGEDAAHVLLDGALGDPQAAGDAGDRDNRLASLGEELQRSRWRVSPTGALLRLLARYPHRRLR